MESYMTEARKEMERVRERKERRSCSVTLEKRKTSTKEKVDGIVCANNFSALGLN